MPRKTTMLPTRPFYILICSLLLSLGGCAGRTVSYSAWDIDAAANYPQERYLSVIGEAESHEQAVSRGYAALAQIFAVTIDEQSSDYSSQTFVEGAEENSLNRQVYSRNLLSSTNQIIEGAAPVAFSQGGGRYQALVVLERDPAAARLRTQINDLDQQTASLISAAEQHRHNPVLMLSTLEKARQLQLERAPLNRNLSVLSGKAIPPLQSHQQLQLRIHQQLAALRLQLNSGPTLLPQLQHAINQLGAQLSPNSDLLLLGELEREPLLEQGGWFWLRGSFQLTLSRGDGEVLSQQRWPFKLAVQQPSSVETRLRDQLSNDIAGQLYQLLTNTALHQ